MQRPAEAISSRIQRVINRAEPVNLNHAGMRVAIVPLRTLRQWLKLAKSIDARMRLDGSPKNRRKKPSVR